MMKVEKADGTIIEMSEQEFVNTYGATNIVDSEDFRKRVNERRAEIIIAGTDVDVTGHGLVPLQGRSEDQTALMGLAMAAQARMGQGDFATPTNFLDRNNAINILTPPQIFELWSKGAGWISAVYQKSWEIKEMDHQTTNPEDDLLWTL